MREQLSNLKLSLEVLQRLDIHPTVSELEIFSQQNKTLIEQFVFQLSDAWKQSLTQENICEQQTDLETLIQADVELEHSAEARKEKVNLEKTSPSLPEKATDMQATLPSIRFKLPNATVGKGYQATVESTSEQPIKVLAIEGLEELGLTYSVEENSLIGEPEKAGEYELLISYQQLDTPSQAPLTLGFNLVINNDPRSLWKSIDSDKTVKYWKQDVDAFGCEGLYGWKMVAASKRGRSHAHVGSCRDDDFAIKISTEQAWHLLAVADGAGSSEYSREGARIIVNNSLEIIETQLQQVDESLTELMNGWQQDPTQENEQALKQLLYDVFSPAIIDSVEKLTALAKADEKAYRDYYSTLLIAAHKPLANGQFTIAYWVGDGVLGIYQQQEKIHLLGEGDSGEYAGQTRFLDDDACEPEDLMNRIRFSFDKDFTALVLMSDGITDPLFETDNRLKNLDDWDDFWQHNIQPQLAETPEKTAEQLVEWLDFWSAGNHDDRTIAMLYHG